MHFVSLTVLTGLALLFVATVGFISFAIARNLKQGLRFRETLAERVRSLRLSRMLEKLGIDLQQYLYSESVSDIETQIRTCKACANTQTCDERLQEAQPRMDDLSFCPNEHSLKAVPRVNESLVGTPHGASGG